MPNPTNDIEKAKQKAEDGLKSRIDEMGSAAYAILIQSIEEIFDISNGKIQADRNFIKKLNKLTITVLDLIQSEPKFTGPVSQFVQRLTNVSEAISAFQKDVNGIRVPAFETAKKIAIDEIVDKMLNNGLNQNFVQPLRDLIYQNVTNGQTLKEARLKIKEFINGNKDVTGKLKSYIEQTAQQSTTAYSGIIGTKLMEQFNYDGMLIVGSLIDTSSPQCRFAINDLHGTIKRTGWPKLRAIAEKHGLVKGTQFNDLPLNLLHWNCNHDFYPVILKKSA